MEAIVDSLLADGHLGIFAAFLVFQFITMQKRLDKLVEGFETGGSQVDHPAAARPRCWGLNAHTGSLSRCRGRGHLKAVSVGQAMPIAMKPGTNSTRLIQARIAG